EVNTFYFLNNDGDVIYRNKIDDWLNTLTENPKNWNIISYEDWIQIYKTSPSDDILSNDSDSSTNNGILYDKSPFDTEEW
ncbi:4826_t:CDS:1, partial [Racocetra fulgida]